MTTKRIATIAMTASLIAFSTAALAQSAAANGEVKKVDATTGQITIRHGPIKAFDMKEPMTMVYRVKDPAMLKSVKVGDKVKFELSHDASGYTVTKIGK
jgi:Cu(I)/Ag(I) efflux system protein CusF